MPGGHVCLVLKVCTAIVTLIFNILQPYLCHFYCSRFNDTGLVIPKIPTVSPSTLKFWTSNFFSQFSLLSQLLVQNLKIFCPLGVGKSVVMKFIPGQFSWIWCKYLQSNFIHPKIFQFDWIQRSYGKIFTAHYVCRNADLNFDTGCGID